MRTAVAILLSSLAICAQADGIYKWKDENGVIHFGSQPPQEQQVEVIKKPKSQRYKQWEAKQQAEADAKAEKKPAAPAKKKPVKDDDTAKQGKAMSKAEQAVRTQRCRMAQSNLQELNSHARVREIGTDGKMRVLPEGERQARISQAQQAIQTNCG
ncbi:DUF4124 domain-containing protein [Microbulbifer sp. SAOS-129_SWC]|uniref:DUF4124 domain-containing protein n=1 Tax=Microbulbifer sp. SAOS-129_SWC TaxID=3145235 RepID=UPI003217722C